MEILAQFIALGAGMFIFFAVFGGIMGLLALAQYILIALSLYPMGKRRGIKCPWLAWIPGLYMIPLAQLSDHYHKVAKNKETKFTMLMLICFIGAWVFAILECGAAVLSTLIPSGAIGLLLVGIVLLLAGIALVLCFAGAILTYIVLFDVYRSAQPKLAVLYLLLSIFVPISWGVCLLIAHKHDQGLPQPEIAE